MRLGLYFMVEVHNTLDLMKGLTVSKTMDGTIVVYTRMKQSVGGESLGDSHSWACLSPILSYFTSDYQAEEMVGGRKNDGIDRGRFTICLQINQN